ncbi:Uncharacterised protein [Mycobacterium tuberculosis]|nr:Uncharacterised protein [Mycobacterium tuberculosis]
MGASIQPCCVSCAMALRACSRSMSESAIDGSGQPRQRDFMSKGAFQEAGGVQASCRVRDSHAKPTP